MLSTLARKLCIAGVLLFASGAAQATFHMWQITELFTSLDGSVQFIQLRALAPGQQFISGHTIAVSRAGVIHSYAFPSNLPGDSATTTTTPGIYGGEVEVTAYKTFLVGTQGFATLTGVTPDYVVPSGFLFTTNGTVTFGEGADVFSYAALPTDGNLALYRDGGQRANSATNFAGTIATVSVPDYTGAWYNASEPGWGLSVIRGTSGAYGVVMYNYNQSRSSTWYFMSGGSMNGTTYSSPVTLYSGPAFSESFGAVPVAINSVGNVTINFTGAATATLSYTINGTTITKSMTKIAF